MNRLDVLLQAEVVCATLSGSGSQTLVEAVMLSAQVQAEASGKVKPKRGRKWGGGGSRSVGVGGTVLGFDAVVMVGVFVFCFVLVPRSVSPLYEGVHILCGLSTLFFRVKF